MPSDNDETLTPREASLKEIAEIHRSRASMWKEAYEAKADELDKLRFPILEGKPGESGVRPMMPADPTLSSTEKAMLIGIALGFLVALVMAAALRWVP